MAKEKPPEQTPEAEKKPLDDDSPKYKTTVTTKITEEEEEELIESFAQPIKALDAAVDKQRQEEHNTMKKLIDDNVKMEREVQKANDRVQEIHTKMELMKLDVEAEKARTREKENRIKEMENEMTMLILAKKTEKKKEKKKGKRAEEVENEAGNITERYKPPEPGLPYNETYDKKIKDLNFRLKRLAADQEAKDKIIVNSETELETTREYANELEKEVSQDKIEEIRKRLEEKQKNKSVHYYDPANIVSRRSGDEKRSSTCSIQ